MIPYVNDPLNQARLGISDAQLAQMNQMLKQWNLCFDAYISPGTYGRLTTAEVNELFIKFKKYTDGFKQQTKGNPSVVLTTADYLYIGVHEDAKPRPSIPPATAEAGVALKLASHLNNEYHTYDIANITKGAKPKDVKRIKIKLLIQKPDAPVPTIDMLEDWDSVGSMNFDIPFISSQVGLVAYVAVCFSNDSGDGPWSAILATTIV